MSEASQAVGNRRLLKLAAFLRKLPRKRFIYTSWVGQTWKGAQDLSCGTTGCALGWAATMPAFRRLGLRLLPPPDSTGLGKPTISPRGTDTRDCVSPLRSAAALFALDLTDATYLFIPGLFERAVSNTYVARKIERFVKAREKAGGTDETDA